VDTTAPTLSLPPDKVDEATGPNGARVNYSGISANDLVDGAMAVNCSPDSGTIFAIGETTVNCSATDKAGNTATGTFTVKVEDTTAPHFLEVKPEDGAVLSEQTATIAGSVDDPKAEVNLEGLTELGG
jgi:hypothetical protein